MSKRTRTILWIVTGVAFLLLVLATYNLAAKACIVGEMGFTAYISDGRSQAYLRETPAVLGQVVTVLSPGAKVLVKNSVEQGILTWYQVSTERYTGWILADQVVLQPPGEN